MEYQLWQLYQQTRFLIAQPLSEALSFAVITACNPRGEIKALSCNRMLDNRLQRAIQTHRWVCRSLYGCSPDLRHRERSWAILIEQQTALGLAGRFQQNALFWVERGELYLVPCLMREQRVQHLGRFRQRVTLVP